MSDELARRRIRVHGRVQGVFFRASTRIEANRLGLTGWVLNHVDGSVELEIQGPADALEAMSTWCREGPPMARVERVEVSNVAVMPPETAFDIRAH